jgi:hypothetical protein
VQAGLAQPDTLNADMSKASLILLFISFSFRVHWFNPPTGAQVARFYALSTPVMRDVMLGEGWQIVDYFLKRSLPQQPANSQTGHQCERDQAKCAMPEFFVVGHA